MTAPAPPISRWRACSSSNRGCSVASSMRWSAMRTAAPGPTSRGGQASWLRRRRRERTGVAACGSFAHRRWLAVTAQFEHAIGLPLAFHGRHHTGRLLRTA